MQFKVIKSVYNANSNMENSTDDESCTRDMKVALISVSDILHVKKLIFYC